MAKEYTLTEFIKEFGEETTDDLLRGAYEMLPKDFNEQHSIMVALIRSIAEREGERFYICGQYSLRKSDYDAGIEKIGVGWLILSEEELPDEVLDHLSELIKIKKEVDAKVTNKNEEGEKTPENQG